MLVTGTTFFFLSYQQNAFDHITVFAYEEDSNILQTFLQEEAIGFDLLLETEDQKIQLTELQTPYRLKVPKGEKIKVKITADSKNITCKLKNGSSSVAGSTEKDIVLERIGNRFKVQCI